MDMYNQMGYNPQMDMMNMQQQQMNMQQSYPQSYPQYPQQDVYGYNYQQQMMGYNQMNIKTNFSKQQIIQALKDYITYTTGVVVTDEVKLDEFPDKLRHACTKCGISFITRNDFPVQIMGITVPFYFCMQCGKLYYYKDFK